MIQIPVNNKKGKTMEFSQLQSLVIEVMEIYCSKFNIPSTPTFAQLKLYEEVGEFTQAYLAHQKLVRPEKILDSETSKESMANELADIIGIAIFNAHLLGIDLEKAFAEKWFDKLGREVSFVNQRSVSTT
jgi:NTP pyrophosphatase (non-canonical NTP hydrolase)